MYGIHLLLALILVIRYEIRDSLSHLDSIQVISTVMNTCSMVEARDKLTVKEDLPSASSVQFKIRSLIAKTNSVNGRFSNSMAETLRCCSIEAN